MSGKPDKTKEDFEKEIAELRVGFDSDLNATLEQRKAHLTALRDLLTENQEAICKALFADLRKSDYETRIQEIEFVVDECTLAIQNLKSWLKPKHVTRYLLQTGDSAYTVREPLGVVLIISAWNYPIMLLLSPLVGALAAGNTCCLKPSPMVTQTSQLIHTLVERYFSPRIVKTVTASADEMSELLKVKFDHICFTGSTRTGQIVAEAAAKHLTSITLELSGKNPVVIDEGADIKLAARRVVFGRYSNAGQACVAPDFGIVIGDTERRSQFATECARCVQEFYGEDAQSSSDYGRLVHKDRFDAVAKLLNESRGTVVCGGQTKFDELYIAPTVIECDLDDATMQEEIFGPLLPVVAMPKMEAAIKFLRSRPKPLVAYIFTNSNSTLERFSSRLSSGALVCNDTFMHMALPTLPFGGVGDSGIGRYHGKYTFKTFSHEKAVLHRPSSWFMEKLQWCRYPPFANSNKLWWSQLFLKKWRPPI